MEHIDITSRPEFGAYLNMAQHNCYIALRHLANLMGYTEEYISSHHIKDFNQGGIKNAFILHKEYIPTEPERREYMRQQILSLFPMLDPFSKRENDKLAMEEISKRANGDDKALTTSELNYKPLEELCAILRKVFDVLGFYRDMSSHAIFNDERKKNSYYNNHEKNVADMLHFTMTVATRIISTRLKLDKGGMDFFINNVHDRRYINKEINGERATLTNTAFSHSVYKNDGINSKGYPVMKNLSETGVVFLACMFLERKYAKMFIDKLHPSFYNVCGKHPQVSQEKINRQKTLLFEIYTVYRMNPPRKKLNSLHLGMANAMDMLNELKKCPAELYDVLPLNKQEEFAITADTGEQVLMRRKTGRFAHMALRWLDENNMMENLRFHVRYGKYHYVFCDEKHCADGIKRVRTIVKDLNGFGKIAEIEARRQGDVGIGHFDTKMWNGASMIRQFENFVPDEAGMKPYITDFQTQYITDNNVIGIYDGDYMPEIGDNNKIANRQPQYWLSLYDIPGLVFYSFLTHRHEEGKYKTAAEIIKTCGEKHQRLLDDLAAGTMMSIYADDHAKPTPNEYKNFCKHYGLNWNEIPERIKDIATGHKRGNFLKSANALMQSEDEDTSRRLDNYERDMRSLTANAGKDNKMGKKRYVTLRPGKMADYLAHDIVRYMPFSKPSDKPTGLNYRILQSSLATFSSPEGLDSIKRILTNLNLMTHPFLKDVFKKNIKNVVDLYKEYLYAKSDYLYDLMDENSRFDEQFLRSVPFINAESMKWAEMDRDNQKRLAEHYRALPLPLPSALFEDDIRKVLLEQYGDILKEVLAKPVCNTSYMIQHYLRLERKDNVQGFYFYPRSGYRIFDLLGCMPSGKEMNENLFALARKNALKVWHNMEPFAKKQWKKEHNGQDFVDCYISKCRKAHTDYKNNERAIRRFATEDTLLFLMAWEVLLDKNISLDGGRLQNVSPTSKDSILSTKIPQISISFNYHWKDENKHHNSKLITINYKNIRIKDWSKLLTLLYDWRLQNGARSLFVQAANIERKEDSPKDGIKIEDGHYTFDYDIIDKELTNFDKLRVDIFSDVVMFENDIINQLIKILPPEDTILEERIDFKKILIYSADRFNINKPSEDDRTKVSQVRNAVCHNTYPDLEKMKLYEIYKADIPEIADAMKKAFDDSANSYMDGIIASNPTT